MTVESGDGEIRYDASAGDEGSVQVVVTEDGIVIDWFDEVGSPVSTWTRTFPQFVEFVAIHGGEPPLAEVAPADGAWVFDANEQRAWGPFDTPEAAGAFVEADKYLSSWAVVLDAAAPALRSATLHSPDAYR